MSFLVWGQGVIQALGYMGVFLTVFAMAMMYGLPTPDFLLVVFAAAFLNPFFVAIFAACASALSEVIAFVLAKRGYQIFKFKQERLNRIRKKLRAHKWFLPFFAILPIPSGFLGVGCGVLDYERVPFVLEVFVGRFIRMFFFAIIGFYGWGLFGFI
jgi:membrane protein YqaA with SNARE-associated domain